MDRDLVYMVCGVAANILIWCIWRPWSRYPTALQSESVTSKENLDLLFEQLRNIQTAQRDLESHLNANTCSQQMQWQQKRDTYAAIVHSLQDISACLTEMKGLIMRREAASTDFKKQELALQISKDLEQMLGFRKQFNDAVALATIFASKEGNQLLKTYLASWSNIREIPSRARVEGDIEGVGRLITQMVPVAKRDLGITQAVELPLRALA
jgi:hypothetical protein